MDATEGPNREPLLGLGAAARLRPAQSSPGRAHGVPGDLERVC